MFVFNKENYSGDAQLVNSVYFDNDSLELYHGRLDKKPGAIALRIRCARALGGRVKSAGSGRHRLHSASPLPAGPRRPGRQQAPPLPSVPPAQLVRAGRPQAVLH